MQATGEWREFRLPPDGRRSTASREGREVGVIKPDGAPVTGIFTTDNMDMKDWLPAMLHHTARQLLGPQGRDLTFLEDKGN